MPLQLVDGKLLIWRTKVVNQVECCCGVGACCDAWLCDYIAEIIWPDIENPEDVPDINEIMTTAGWVFVSPYWVKTITGEENCDDPELAAQKTQELQAEIDGLLAELGGRSNVLLGNADNGFYSGAACLDDKTQQECEEEYSGTFRAGKLCAEDPCGGFCCYCVGPAYYYLAFGPELVFKPFGGLNAPGQGWDCSVYWLNPATNQTVTRPRGVAPPPGYDQFSYMICNSQYFRCKLVEALQNDTLGYGGLNGANDQQNGTTDWQTFAALGRRNACVEDLSQQECEQCVDVVDLTTAQAYCGTFTSKASSPDSQCCFPAPLYDEGDKQNCICPNPLP